jgi:hypothetical protein
MMNPIARKHRGVTYNKEITCYMRVIMSHWIDANKQPQIKMGGVLLPAMEAFSLQNILNSSINRSPAIRVAG